ncbi:MAG: hypothetical protein ACREE6_18095, partial [Limisphaerales bacterium]
LAVLHGLPSAAPAKETVSLEWKNADLLEADVPIEGGETVLNTVEVSGQKPVTLPPVCLPYSPEFAPDQPGRGAAALAQIAATTGGKERVEIPKIWMELPVRSRYVTLAPWLLVLAAFLFLLEIVERRAGWLSKLAKLRIKSREGEEFLSARQAPMGETEPPTPKSSPQMAQPVTNKSNAPAPDSAAAKAGTKPVPPKSADDEGSTLGAMRQARDRARRNREKL